MDKFPVIISFDKSISDITDTLEIIVSSNQSLSSLSQIACAKIGISYNPRYEFINTLKVKLSMSNSVEDNNITKNYCLILFDPEKDTYSLDQSIKNLSKNSMWRVLAISAMFLSLCAIIILVTIYIINLSSIYTYGVVIDAGSTSSKIYLYYWASNKYIYNADVLQINNCKTNSGISSYESNINQSFSEIQACLENDIIPKIPNDLTKKSFVYLGATAGMRMLQYNNPNASEQIMNFVRHSLSRVALKLNNPVLDVSIISGVEEGSYGWITVNYLSKTLPKTVVSEPIETLGALDMGGASTEITFVDSSNVKSNSTFPMKLYGNTYSIYSYSYLCYGKSQAEMRFLAVLIQKNDFNTTLFNPCFPKGQKVIYGAIDIFTVPCVIGRFAVDNYGYEIVPPNDWMIKNTNITFIGQSDNDYCEKVVKELFNTTKCNQPPCTFNGVYQPEVKGNFKAFSAYKLIRTILNKDNENMGLRDYRMKLTNLCNSEIDQKINVIHKEDIWVKWQCFDLTYMIEILMRLGFNENNWRNIEFIDMIDNLNIEWALGSMIVKTSIIPKEKHFLPIENYLFAILFVVFLIILIFGFLFGYCFWKSRRYRIDFKDYSNLIEEQTLLSVKSHEN